MRLKTVLGLTSVLLSGLIGVTTSATSVVGQEAAPQHPADIRLGSCDSLGEVVVPLNALVVPEGDPQGQRDATPVEESVTEVPLLVGDLLADHYAVAVHASPEQVGTPIACGAIGGTLSDDGTLSVGLPAMNGTKRSGVASFAPTAAGDSTVVTVLLVAEGSGRQRDDAPVTDGDAEGGTGADSPGADGAGGDGAAAADGVGNVEVGPAPDRARGTDGSDPMVPAGPLPAPPGVSAHPGDDGAADRPGRDRDGARSEEGDRSGARAGEDGGRSD